MISKIQDSKFEIKNIEKINHFKHVAQDGDMWNATPEFFIV